MNLTFKGFLKSYCRELSGERTLSLRELVRMAAEDAPRLAEPVFLLATAEGKSDYLRGLAEGTWMEAEYGRAAEILEQSGKPVEETLSQGMLPERYQSVWDAYRGKRCKPQNDRRVNGLMREKTLAALERAGMTCYRLCKELGLNKGNVYAYLHRGDDSKVSRDTARAIMAYAQKQALEPVPVRVRRG